MDISPQQFQSEFLSRLGGQRNFAELFSYLNDIHFFVKDKEGRFVMFNHTGAEQFGTHDEYELIGKTDYDYLPEEMIKNYRADDKQVIEEEKRIINRVELVPNADGTVSWFSTNKVPLYDKNGQVMGLAGNMRNLKKASASMNPFVGMEKVIDYISNNYHTRIEIHTLANLIPLSISQFEKKFKKVFRQTPSRFIINVRVKVACELLTRTGDSLASIAAQTGFYDASSFSRQFKKYVGVTPKQYRTAYAKE